MRNLTVELAGKKYELKADFAASLRIAKEVGDPLLISREANMEAYFLGANIPYEPKWKFTIKNVVAILAIGTGMDEEEMGAIVFQEGFIRARDKASLYLNEIIGPGPEEVAEEEEGNEGAGKSSGSTS